MVAWPWLILAFVIGGSVGLVIMAVIACGREDDRMMEARYEKKLWIDEAAEIPQTVWDSLKAYHFLLTEKVNWEGSRYEDRDNRDSGSGSGTGGDNGDGGIQYPHRATGGTDRQPTGRD